MINNRQAGRRRGRNNNPRQNGGGNRGNGDSGNRIDSRARGNAAQLLEKYRNMARDAHMSGDRVNAEYYLQFADHYFRVLADNRARQEEQNPQRFRRNDESLDGADFDMADEGDEAQEFGGEGSSGEESQQQGNRDRDYQAREDRPRRNDDNRERSGNRDRNERGRDNRRDNDDNRGNRRDDRGERSDRGERADRGERRPRIANDDSDEHDGTLNLAALPPAIGRVEEPAASDEPEAVEAPKPRRGRRPRSAEAAE